MRLPHSLKLFLFVIFSGVGVATAQAAPPFSCEPRAHTPLLAYDFEPVLQGLSQPTSATHAGDGSDRLFITEKSGLVRVVSEEKLLSEPFLDLRAEVVTQGEQGLLSLAFHPNFEHNGRFFVFYSKAGKDGALPLSVLEAYRVSANNPNRAALGGTVLLSLPQTRLPIHKGGQLEFGPDGYLYVSLGDGDLPDEAQKLASLKGTVLRLDVDSSHPYSIPADNPFVGHEGARPEIWAYGFRNPWRFSIDPCTSELFVGDVGSERFEEVNLVEPGGNYGWPPFEGVTCVGALFSCDFQVFAFPLYTYGHLHLDPKGGNAVIGGIVYRGGRYPQLRGRYLFSDFASRALWVLTRSRAGVCRHALLGTVSEPLSAFAVDKQGEILALGFASGTLYQLDNEELDFAESDFRQARLRTIALENLESVETNRRLQYNGTGSSSRVIFHLAKRQRLAFYFEAVSPVAEQKLSVFLNGRHVASYSFEGDSRWDWVPLAGKPGRNVLYLRYGVKTTPFSLRFKVLELSALEEAL